MKVIDEYFPVVLFTMFYKVAPTTEYVESVKCDHLNFNIKILLSNTFLRTGTVNYPVQLSENSYNWNMPILRVFSDL